MSVIGTATDTVIGTIPVDTTPSTLAVTPDGSRLYIAIQFDNTVRVMDTATNTLVGSPITPVGPNPYAFGMFIQPREPIQFAGTPGASNCVGQTVSALAQQFGDLGAAAIALGYPNVQALQTAVQGFCRV